VVVVGAAMLVTVIGLSSLLATRVRMQFTAADQTMDWYEASLNARSIVEDFIGVTSINNGWRSYPTSAGTFAFEANAPGRGTCSITLEDTVDNDIRTDPDHKVRMTAVGTVNGVTARYRVDAEPPPIGALKTAVYAQDYLYVGLSSTLTVNGAPAFCGPTWDYGDGLVRVWWLGKIAGNVEATTITSNGTITGTRTTTVPPRDAPLSGTLDYYAGLSTAVTLIPDPNSPYKIEKKIISHNLNPYGSCSSDGLYVLNLSNVFTIENCRIEGTLVVRTGIYNLTIGKGIVWVPHRRGYPALLVDGTVGIKLNSTLSESSTSTNFNPAALPFEGLSDTDKTDTYTSVIRGIVAVQNGDVTLDGSTRIDGSLIAAGPISVDDFASPTINWDPNVVQTVPPRFRSYRLNILPGTWRQLADPNADPNS